MLIEAIDFAQTTNLQKENQPLVNRCLGLERELLLRQASCLYLVAECKHTANDNTNAQSGSQFSIGKRDRSTAEK